mmetsp:Transcript_16260/g.28818  ORF Transcript_16260/g.28818 Transcript_16260/m.28818 type:complete len:248 (+) Transcript_16260:191-934(+)
MADHDDPFFEANEEGTESNADQDPFAGDDEDVATEDAAFGEDGDGDADAFGVSDEANEEIMFGSDNLEGNADAQEGFDDDEYSQEAEANAFEEAGLSAEEPVDQLEQEAQPFDQPNLASVPAPSAAPEPEQDDSAYKAFESQWKESLAKKDVAYEASREQMRESAKSELESFYAERKANTSSKAKANRESEQETLASIEEQPSEGNTWKRVSTLVDMSGPLKTAADHSDVARQRGILIQLKSQAAVA